MLNVPKVFPQVLIREQFYPGREFLKSNVWGQTNGSWEVRVGHTLISPASWIGVRVWLVYSWKLILSTHPRSTESEYLWLRPSNYILISSPRDSSRCCKWRTTVWKIGTQVLKDLCNKLCWNPKAKKQCRDHCNELWSLFHSSGLSLRLITLWELKGLEVYISST